MGHALFERAQFVEAGKCFREVTRLEPNQSYFHWTTALCLCASGEPSGAGEYLETAVKLDPTFSAAQAWLGQWYLERGVIEPALRATARAMELTPKDFICIQARAWVLEAAGDSDGAWQLIQRMMAAGQMNASLAQLYGRLASRYGQQEQAITLVSGMLGAGGGPAGAALYFTAADLLDHAGKYDDAFACAAKGNALRLSRYEPAAQAKLMEEFIRYFTRQRMGSLARARCQSDKVVFIVGMPRSGTSLVEQILASHPAIHGAGELDLIERVFLGTLGMLRAEVAEYPRCLDRLTTEQADGMAGVYIGALTGLAPQAQRITNKTPLNFLQLGLISLLFPNAKVIHCRRNPMDTCLSCYMTHFNTGHEFARNLAHLGHFYRQYERLMMHWKRTLDVAILDVVYEETVADPEGQSRRMVEFLELPWEEKCLRFYDTKRAVVTASVQQVRQPIYNTSVQRWKHYEKHLGPLKGALWGK
jgi:tetratricopeptide (TPR) repeat protein